MLLLVRVARISCGFVGLKSGSNSLRRCLVLVECRCVSNLLEAAGQETGWPWSVNLRGFM